MSKRTIIPYGAIRFCLGLLIVLVVLIALFLGGLAIYADTQGISFAQAWENVWQATRQTKSAVTPFITNVRTIFACVA